MSLSVIERVMEEVPPTAEDYLIKICIENGAEGVLVITATWQVAHGSGHYEHTVRVSDALKATLASRAGFRNLVADVRDDTHERAIA